jgi:hypothetical protein
VQSVPQDGKGKKKQPQLEIKEKTVYDLVVLMDDIIRVLGDAATLAEIAAKSYIHKNGFIKLVYETIEETVCRLHIYPLGASADKNIHDHRWDFSSVTICGSLPMSLYAIIDGDSEIIHKYSKTLSSGHIIQSISPCSSELVETVHSHQLHGYYMPSHIFHRIEAVEELTITYVETYPATSDYCHLVSFEDRSGDGQVQPEPLTIEETRQALELVVSKIAELI